MDLYVLYLHETYWYICFVMWLTGIQQKRDFDNVFADVNVMHLSLQYALLSTKYIVNKLH